MSQINRYNVTRIGSIDQGQNLDTRDSILITSYSLGNSPFLVGKYGLRANFYTLDGLYLETVPNIETYTVLGANKGDYATEISVDPVQDSINNGYLGDVQVEYEVQNNIFSPSHSLDLESTLFIQEISVDRTEIRATSLNLSEVELQNRAQELYRRLNEEPYFTGVNLNFLDDNETAWCLNVATEILNGNLVVAFKLYEPLPDTVDLKSRFTVEEQIGEPVRFQVIRTVEVTEDEQPRLQLRGPNFGVEEEEERLGTVTEYLNYQELFSYPKESLRSELYSIYNQQGIELSIDHSDFANFVHLSSAAERLENFRYKLKLLKGYQQELEKAGTEAEITKLNNLIQGILDNFDHYDRYLYYTKADTSWPKESDQKPYINCDPESDEATEWFTHMLRVAQNYDESNPDILINTIPAAVRQDSRNEPYVVFIHMIGQHFDDEWLYARAVSDRFNGDNRLDFGLSKDLVREALTSFGLELKTTNQNLEQLFNLCRPGQSYDVGTETSVTEFMQITINVDGHSYPVPVSRSIYDGEYARWREQHPDETLDGWYAYWSSIASRIADGGAALSPQDLEGEAEFQPVFIEDYRKEIYKRLYHNIPLILKTKGTSRGLRALITCFGIPEEILEIAVSSTAESDETGAFFGPENRTTSSLDRITINTSSSLVPQLFKLSGSLGSFVPGTTLTEDVQTSKQAKAKVRGSHVAEVGFRLNKEFDDYVKKHVSASFDYDNVVGDPGNTGENYGTAFSVLRNNILAELWGDSGSHLSPTGLKQDYNFRSPAAILRLVRYFDSALFKTLQTLTPARDNVEVGAIVDDNILHRNRYTGARPQALDLKEYTGSIDTVFIDGGDGGCLQVLRTRRPSGKPAQTQSFVIHSTIGTVHTESRICPTVNYTEEGVSVGSKNIPRIIFDDSPRFNGELKGTINEIVDGELTAGNIYRKGGSSLIDLNYVLDLRFLCLPREPINTVVDGMSQILGFVFNLNIPEKSTVECISGSIGISQPNPKGILLRSEDTISINISPEDERVMLAGWYWGECKSGQNYLASSTLDGKIPQELAKNAVVLLSTGNITEIERLTSATLTVPAELESINTRTLTQRTINRKLGFSVEFAGDVGDPKLLIVNKLTGEPVKDLEKLYTTEEKVNVCRYIYIKLDSGVLGTFDLFATDPSEQWTIGQDNIDGETCTTYVKCPELGIEGDNTTLYTYLTGVCGDDSIETGTIIGIGISEYTDKRGTSESQPLTLVITRDMNVPVIYTVLNDGEEGYFII